jgi:fructokinase
VILVIGEILFDIFPYDKRLGGAPFNFAFHLKSLGLPVIFASRVGDDENGKDILQVIRNSGFDTKFIQVDSKRKTGYVTVTLDQAGSPEFTIIKDVAYDYLSYRDEIKSVLSENIRLIYYGTLIQRTYKASDTLIRIFRKKDPKTKCFCDINLRPDCYNEDIIKISLVNCDILKISDEELDILKHIFQMKENDEAFIDYLMKKLSIEWISLTKGKAGSVLFTAGHSPYSFQIEESPNTADTVGAGDAYAAVLALGYLYQWEPSLILKRASQFAAAVCEIRGAIPDHRDFYQKFADWV